MTAHTSVAKLDGLFDHGICDLGLASQVRRRRVW
jgi:hypothetical protein